MRQKLFIIVLTTLIFSSFIALAQSTADNPELKSKIETLGVQCEKDIDTCNCVSLGDEQAIKNCDKNFQEQYKITKQFRENCLKDLDACDCSQLKNSIAQTVCESRKKLSTETKTNVDFCKNDPLNCDCSMMKISEAVKECENKKEESLKQSKGEMEKKIGECFSNIEKCDCSSMGKKEQVEFCSSQINIARACKETGQFCDKIENLDLTPPGIPEFLKPFFQSTLKLKIDAEKNKAVNDAIKIAQECVLDPSGCKCESIPSAFRSTCIERRTMQIECQVEKNIDVCEKLDAITSYVPQNTPAFIKIPLEKILKPLIDLQKEQIKGKAAQETGKMIEGCIEDVNACDCSQTPPKFRNFCQQKIDKAKKCYAGDFDTCFNLMDEDPLPSDMPGFIRVFVEPGVKAKIKEVSGKMYLKMRHGECEKLSLSECKKLWAAGQLKK